jgi:hypothetical protein
MQAVVMLHGERVQSRALSERSQSEQAFGFLVCESVALIRGQTRNLCVNVSNTIWTSALLITHDRH